jgi:hypothetical protein
VAALDRDDHFRPVRQRGDQQQQGRLRRLEAGLGEDSVCPLTVRGTLSLSSFTTSAIRRNSFPDNAMASAKKAASKKASSKKSTSKKKADPCWDGYERIGSKKKAGKTVPNCVPEK